MIGRLRGELVDVDGNLAVVDCAGVGYEVSLPEAVLVQLPLPGEQVVLLTRQVFRADGVSLYGFLQPFQRRLFDLLLTVKGCGPKVGLALIGQLGDQAVASAILVQDPKVLTRAAGVGPRLAERIVLELKDKMQEEAIMRKIEASIPAQRSEPSQPDELIEALLALGYTRKEAEVAAVGARTETGSVPEQLKVALRSLRR